MLSIATERDLPNIVEAMNGQANLDDLASCVVSQNYVSIVVRDDAFRFQGCALIERIDNKRGLTVRHMAVKSQSALDELLKEFGYCLDYNERRFIAIRIPLTVDKIPYLNAFKANGFHGTPDGDFVKMVKVSKVH